MKLTLLDRYARSHHGLVTLAAAQEVGLSRATWHRAIRDGQVEHLHPGVARIAGTPKTPAQAICAATLAAGGGALASHRSAAALWGVPRPDDDPPEIILPERTRQATLQGVVVHRPRDHGDLRPVWRSGIPTTNILRMLCDIGAVDPGGVDAAVGHVVTRGLATVNALHTAIRAHSRRGRQGVPAFRDCLVTWLSNGKPLDSELERRMTAIAKKYRLPPLEFHATVAGHEVDFLVAGTRVILECDGWEFHDLRKQLFERDREQRIDLSTAGYIVVPFTWSHVTRRPKWVAAKVFEAVARWSNLSGVELGGMSATKAG